MNSALLSSKKMDWCTPQDFFDRLNEEFGFVLDAAATDKTAKCPLCVLKSEILKSYLDGDTRKRAEAVDMMKHIAAAWNIKPEEVFEKGE